MSDTRFERRINGLSKLVQHGMRMLVRIEKDTREFRNEIREFKDDVGKFRQEVGVSLKRLADAQAKTEKLLQKFIAAQINGRGRRSGH